MSFDEVNFIDIDDNHQKISNTNSYVTITDVAQDEILDQITINDLLQNLQDEITITRYKVKWCGHCKKLKSEWKKLRELVKDMPHIIIKSFDYEKNEDEITKIINNGLIKGFPTIIINKNNSEIIYTGERTAVAILDYCKPYKLPEILNIKNDALFLELANKYPNEVNFIPEIKLIMHLFQTVKSLDNIKYS